MRSRREWRNGRGVKWQQFKGREAARLVCSRSYSRRPNFKSWAISVYFSLVVLLILVYSFVRTPRTNLDKLLLTQI